MAFSLILIVQTSNSQIVFLMLFHSSMFHLFCKIPNNINYSLVVDLLKKEIGMHGVHGNNYIPNTLLSQSCL
jgi:hypothetical protein